MTDQLSVAAAFVAGLVSFVTPCHLALVPGYLSYLAGFTLAEPGAARQPGPDMSALANTLLFALGFTAVFVALGAALGGLSQAVAAAGLWLDRLSGSLIIALGLVSLGLLRAPFLERTYLPGARLGRRARYAGSVLIGATFAAGWTPCVGPLLGAILVLAGASGSAGQGSLLLASYALGLMLPFIGAGLLTGWTSWLLRRHGRWLTYATQVAGVLLIALGIAVFTGLFSTLSSYLALGV